MEKNQNNGIEINARIDKIVNGEGKIKAYVSVTLGKVFAVHGIRIIETDKGVVPRMPYRSYKVGNETKYADIFHAVTSEFRAELDETIMSAYEQSLSEQVEENSTNIEQHM